MVACGYICSLSAFKTRMSMEKSKKEKSPWVKVKKKSRNLTCLNWQKNLLEFNKGLWFLGNLHCWVCWDSAGGFCFSIGISISSFLECWPNLICVTLCRGFTCVARFDLQLIHLKKHCPFGIDLPHSVYNKI